MDIFIWKSYGDIEVFATETPEQLIQLLKNILACIETWDMEHQINKANLFIEQNGSTIKNIRKTINYILDEVNVGSHEQFELGTRFSKLK